jgi:hypothetical protein
MEGAGPRFGVKCIHTPSSNIARLTLSDRYGFRAWTKSGQLDWWVKDQQRVMGRVRGADGRQPWVRAPRLLGAACGSDPARQRRFGARLTRRVTDEPGGQQAYDAAYWPSPVKPPGRTGDHPGLSVSLGHGVVWRSPHATGWLGRVQWMGSSIVGAARPRVLYLHSLADLASRIGGCLAWLQLLDLAARVVNLAP